MTNSESGYQAPIREVLKGRAADLKRKIMMSWGNTTTCLPRLLNKVPDQSLFDNVNTALQNIPTTNTTETNQLVYIMASVIVEMLGYKINNISGQKPEHPWKRRLEAKIKATRREVSLLTS